METKKRKYAYPFKIGEKMIKKIVMLWHETQTGNIHKCREKQLEFSEMMWKLYEQYKEKEDGI